MWVPIRKIRTSSTVFGITGGIASGKSTVGDILSRLGYRVFDLDALARHKVLANPLIAENIASLLDDPSLYSGVGLNKTKIREIIFSDPQKREKLNSYLHPLIIQVFHEEVEKASHEKIIFCEAALIFETNFHMLLRGTLLVLAPTHTRLLRLQQRDGIEPSLALLMIESQLPDSVKESMADYVVINDSTQEALKEKVQSYITHIESHVQSKGKNS